MINLHFDGLVREIPPGQSAGSRSYKNLPGGTASGAHHAGFLCYGWLITRDGVTLARGHGAFARGRDATSNVAEYLALIEGLEALGDMGVKDEAVRVLGDAKCVIDQMVGTACVKSPSMKPLYRRAKCLANRFDPLLWIWTPRRHNRDADSLTRRAMKQIRSDPQGYDAAVHALDTETNNGGAAARLFSLIDLRVYYGRLASSHRMKKG